ncbi:MAG: TSUP family transporter [Candidatus Omnitrophota bacterium]
MESLIVCGTALLVSGLTFFSGFGLGTVLMPVLALFFPVPIAVAATALVHFANNLFKLVLVGRSVNRAVLIRFAVPAMLAAFLGAWALSYAALLPALGQYELMGKIREINILHLVIGSVIVGFAVLEMIPGFSKAALDHKHMIWGGLLSGFFGGLSGHQGALRSMFLIKAGLNKEEFIGTGVASAVLVDAARLSIYGTSIFATQLSVISSMKGLLLAATLSAFAGASLGRELLKKVTLRTVQVMVGVMLILLGISLSLGLI